MPPALSTQKDVLLLKTVLLGMCVGLMWKGFETYSQISFRCDARFMLVPSILLTSCHAVEVMVPVRWAGTSSWLAWTGFAPRSSVATSAASEELGKFFFERIVVLRGHQSLGVASVI